MVEQKVDEGGGGGTMRSTIRMWFNNRYHERGAGKMQGLRKAGACGGAEGRVHWSVGLRAEAGRGGVLVRA